MAKKRKKPVTRRRRVGAVSGGLVPQLAGVAAGALLGRIIAGKFLASMDPKIAALVQLAAGGFLIMQRQPIVKGIGAGMFANGAVSGGQAMKLIAGVNQSSFMQDINSNEVPVISGDFLNYLGNPQGSPDMAVISGVGYADDLVGQEEPDQLVYQGGGETNSFTY